MLTSVPPTRVEPLLASSTRSNRSRWRGRSRLEGLRAGLAMLRSPDQRTLDTIFALNDALRSRGELARMVARASSHSQGAAAIARRMRIRPVDTVALATFAPGTLGSAYAEYIERLG